MKGGTGPSEFPSPLLTLSRPLRAADAGSAVGAAVAGAVAAGDGAALGAGRGVGLRDEDMVS